MTIKKVKSRELFHINDVGERCLNIYYGCLSDCPFCYWQTDKEWASGMTAYIDVVDILREEVKNLPKGSKIIMGYKGNPYTPQERKLKLTRECLKLLLENDMTVMLSSSRGNDIILRDLDILTAYRENVLVLMELTRLDVVEEFNKAGTHLVFDVANTLKRNGLNICTTISPVLPGITDVERMAEALPEIPVHISTLDIRPGTLWNKKTLEYIAENHKALLPVYEKIAETGVDYYYESLKEKYDGSGQILPYLPFWDEVPVI